MRVAVGYQMHNQAKQSDPFSVPPLAPLQMVVCWRRYEACQQQGKNLLR